MRAPALAALGVAAFAIFLVATIPARWVLREAEARSAGAFQLREATGTLWNGSAAGVVASSVGQVPLDRIEWSFRPERIFAAQLAFDVRASSGGMQLRGIAARSLERLHVDEASLEGPAGVATSWLPWLAPWRPDGRINGAARSVSFDGREWRGQATLEWRAASIALSEVRPLGDFRAELRGEGGPARVVLSTMEGPLRLAGQGTLDAGKLDLTGEARAEGPQAAALEPLLDLVGPRRPDGARSFEWHLR